MTTVRFEVVEVGKGREVRVDAPFAAKDAIKSTGFARWHAKRKMWTVPLTAMALQETRAAVARALPDAQILHDAPCDALANAKTVLADVDTSDPVAGAVLPPWTHQRVGIHMVGQLGGCMLAWDMGSGKTKAIYDAIVHYDFRLVLVTCPSSVISVWGREAAKHVPDEVGLEVLMLTGKHSVAQRASLLEEKVLECAALSKPLIVVTNYEAAWRTPLSKTITSLTWDLVVADESHRISNVSTNIGKFMAKQLAPKARHRVCLTGTPMGNGPIDAFGQFAFIEPALFGTAITRFRAKYCVMGGFEGREVVDYQNLDDFKERMSRVSTRVRLRDVVDLPEYQDEERLVELCPAATRMYRDVRDDFIAQHAKGVVTATNAVAKLLRLQQITSGFCSVTYTDPAGVEKQAIEPIDRGKSDALKEIATDAAHDEPIVVFVRFRPDLETVHRVALESGRTSFEISGGTNQQDLWENECRLGTGPIIAVQIQAGGVGIDLTPARYCVYYSVGFNLTDYLQSRARVYRPGQTRGVVYYHLIAEGTVDRVVYRALRRKGNVVDAVVESITGASELA